MRGPPHQCTMGVFLGHETVRFALQEVEVGVTCSYILAYFRAPNALSAGAALSAGLSLSRMVLTERGERSNRGKEQDRKEAGFRI